jgi:hypothetical protein
MQTSEPLLIVITGPVGGGKSSTALALSRVLQETSLAAVIDLDQIYGFVRQSDEADDDVAWQRARRGAAGLALALFDAGIIGGMDLNEAYVPIGPVIFFLQLAWYVGVTVLLVRIWRKVRHLPG